MKRARPLAAILALIFGIPANVALSGASECRSAVDRYNSVLDDVGTSLRRYANCVSGSRGHDDCSSEFHHLRSDQDDFESAVSEIHSECD